MSIARPVNAGRIVLVTRRCSERRFFLRPVRAVNDLFGYLFAEAAERSHVDVVALHAMSNHYHALLVDREGELPDFFERFHSLVARSVNAHLGRYDHFWEGRQTNVVGLDSDDPELVLDRASYVLCQGVAAGLVRQGKEWPGVRTAPAACANKPQLIVRPTGFFKANGSMPAEATLRVVVPPSHAHLSPAQFANLLTERVQTREAELHAEAKAAGRSFVGARGVLKTPWRDSPKTPAPRCELVPRVAASTPERRKHMLEELFAFTKAYAAARDAYIRGNREVLFPCGTWQLRVHHRVLCHPPPL